MSEIQEHSLKQPSESLDMDDILKGIPPTVVFGEILSRNPNFSNQDLARIFVRRFPNVKATANNLIWYWKSSARSDGGLDDNLVNKELLDLLANSGYL